MKYILVSDHNTYNFIMKIQDCLSRGYCLHGDTYSHDGKHCQAMILSN